jgi:hypothetical protein
MTPKGADLEATDLIEVSTLESGSYVTRSITGQELIDAIPLPPSGLTVGTTPIASGTVGRVLFEGTGNVLQQSTNLFWDNTNARLGIGTSIPGVAIDVQSNVNSDIRASVSTDNASTAGAFIVQHARGTIAARTSLMANDRLGGFFFSGYNGTNFVNPTALIGFAGENFSGSVNGAYFGFETTANGTNTRTEKVRINGNGNVLINTTTDAGFRLDVNGTARVQNTLTVTKGASNFFSFEPSANGTAPYIQGFFAGFTDSRIYFDTGFFKLRSAGTSLTLGLDCGSIFSNGNIELVGSTQQKVKIAGQTNNFIQFTQAGISNRGTIGYAAGQSFMQIRVNAASDLTDGTFSTAFFSTGNVGINTTTDAGYKLDVNGTARVSGQLTVTGNIVGTALLTASQNQTFTFFQRRTTVSGDAFVIDDANIGGGSGINVNILNLAGSWQTTGTCVHNNIAITRAINLTSGTQTVRGFYYNPTLTNTTGLTTHHAFHSTSGRIRFENLPTSATGLSAGDLWNDGGTLKIV